MTATFDDWQRPEWVARRDDGTWSGEPSRPPSGYSVAWIRDGVELAVFESFEARAR